ncbi:MAG: hypothetical protein EB120_00835 [Proteobacteria bacterium]|nr:hypothetical protein [Pseudomonadota bacterium]
MTKNEIICEILEQTTPDELMTDLENADIEWYTDVVCDVVFQRTVGYRDVYEALCWFAENSLGAAENSLA